MRKLIVLALLIVVTAMSVPVMAATDPETRLEQIEQEIKDLNRQIAAQKGERTKVQEQLAAAEASLAVVRAELEAAEAKVHAVEEQITTAEAELDQIRQELSDLEAQLAETQLDIFSKRELLRDRAVEMYMEGMPNLGVVAFAAGDMTQMALGVSYATQVVSKSQVLVHDLEGLQGLEQRQRTAVQQRKDAAQSLLADLETRRTELDADRAEVAVRTAEAQAQMKEQQALLDKVNHDIGKFEGELTALERESKKMEAEIAARQASSGERPSKLAWPVNGPVTSPFGWRIHPIFGTKKLHTGIDIGVGYGTPIKAASYGTVILAQRYGGYGNATVVDHGGGLSTLYAHQSKIIVKVGQKVDLGQVIGYVGCTGYCTGPHLHFETRENGTPVDPMKYLP